MPRVAVDEEMLRWAVKRSGKTVEQLSRGQLKKLDEWLDGERSPTLRQLQGLSRATLTPLGYLMLSEPPEEQLPVADFRSLSDKDLRSPSPELLRTIHMMQRRQDWMREYCHDLGCGPLRFVNSLNSEEDTSERAAEEIRSFLGLGRLWAQPLGSWTEARRYLKEIMEDAGIIVVFNSVVGNNTHRKLSVEEFRGFVLVDEYAPLVFVNSGDSQAAQLFTLAHEVAHLAFGISSVFDLRNMQPSSNPIEILCDATAAEFLVPGDEFSRSWREVAHTRNRFGHLAHQYKVRELVTARRALDLDLIPRDEFIEFYLDYQRNIETTSGKRGKGGASFYTLQDYRLGAPFASAVNRAVREGRILYTEAYELTNLRGKTFDRYMEHIRRG